jgi:tetratricopeptide (TPR) repeat protein
MLFVCTTQVDVATTNSSIGDCLLALGRDGEALLCYEKVLMDFKNLKGDNHSLVASAFVNLAEFHLRINKPGEAKSYCEATLRIYGKQGAGHAPGDVAHGLADSAAILEELNKRLPFSSCNGLSTSLTNHQVRSYSCPLE